MYKRQTDGKVTAVNSSGSPAGVVTNRIQRTVAALTFKKQVEENAYRPDVKIDGFAFV